MRTAGEVCVARPASGEHLEGAAGRRDAVDPHRDAAAFGPGRDFDRHRPVREAPDGRADVFSLGWVLYTLIAGYGWAWQVGTSETIEADAKIDAELKTILLTAVEQDVDRRYPSIGEMSAALAVYLESIWPGRAALDVSRLIGR